MTTLPPSIAPVKTQRPANTLRPIHGSARWLDAYTAEDLDCGLAALEITSDGRTTRFRVERIVVNGKVAGYRLRKDDGAVYDIDVSFGPGPDGWECDCPDGLNRGHRPGGCRHRAALFAALKKIPGA